MKRVRDGRFLLVINDDLSVCAHEDGEHMCFETPDDALMEFGDTIGQHVIAALRAAQMELEFKA